MGFAWQFSEGNLPQDKLLRQEELAKQFGLSRAPVREALRQLEALFSYPHGGTVVAEDQSDHDPNPAHSAELNWVFHEILYAPAGLPRMLNIIKTLHYQALRYHLVGFVALDFKRESQGGHRRILEA